MGNIAATAFKDMALKAGKGVSKKEARALSPQIQEALSKELAGLKSPVATVDKLALKSAKHGKIKIKVKAHTEDGLIAKIKGWLSKDGTFGFKAPKVKEPKAVGGAIAEGDFGASPSNFIAIRGD